MKKVLVFIVGVSFCSSVDRLKREVNQNCPDLELWSQCATKCDQILIGCIQNCEDSSDIICVSECNRENIFCRSGCPCDEKCPAGCIGCNNDICFQNFGALLVLDDVGHGIDPNKQLFWLLDRDANEIDGLNFQYGEGTDVSAACATSFKGEMYLFGGYFIKDQVSLIRDCALQYAATMPFQLQKGACQARLDNQVLLCFSDHETSSEIKGDEHLGRRKCWKFDEENGQYKYDNEILEAVYDHQHNPMAMYDGNALAIGSCWGLEVEMFDRNDRNWIRLDDFPNPGGYGFEIFDTVSLDDRFYTFGGYWKNGTYGDHVYQFKDFQWSLAGQMLGARGASFAVRFDREIFIIGGYPIEILEPDHEFYPVHTEKWNLEDNNDLSIGSNKFTGVTIERLAYPLVFVVPSDFCIVSS